MVLGLGPWGARVATAQQDADAYFHEAAQHYIAQNVPAARQAVEQGLEIAPADPRLLALRRKLNEADRRNRGGEGGTGDASRQSGKQGGAGNQRRSSSEEEERSSQKTGAQDSSGAGEEQEQRAAPGGEENPETQAEGSRSSQGEENRSRNVLSRAQAERLLRALELQEQRLLRSVQKRGNGETSVEKDW